MRAPYFYPEDFAGTIFVGRDQELLRLHELLGQTDRVAIAAVGMGGIGKTTLARRYVQQHRADYPGGIWWVAVDELVAQVLDYAGRSVGLEELRAELSEAQIVQHYLARWEAQWPGRKLLVLDDVGEYGAVKGFLPQQGAFVVLMTTRVQMQRPVECLPLEVLEPPDALSLLQQLMGDDERLQADVAVAEELCEWLGYLPLGIELVGRYLAETSRSVAAVLGQLQEKALAARAIVTVADEMDYERNVQAAIELSWQVLDERAQQVVMMLGLFALAPVKAEWVVAALPEWDADDLEDCLDRQLVKRSLLNRERLTEGSRYQLHSLVRAFLQAKWTEAKWADQADMFQRSFARAVTAIAQAILPPITIKQRARWFGVTPHIEIAVNQQTTALGSEDKVWCYTGLLWFYQDLGSLVEAERSGRRALKISQAELGKGHIFTSSSLNNLAALYKQQGRYNEAEPLQVEALEICKVLQGDCHIDTAANLNNLATLYDYQGRYTEAEPLQVKALEICKVLSDVDPLYIAFSLNNLAELYSSQKRYTKAEPLFIEALQIRQAELGEHPHTASSLNNLAELYRTQGQNKVAELMLIEAIQIWEATLGSNHLSTAISLSNLALLYESQKRYEEAEVLHLKSLQIRRKEAGDHHPSTAASLSNLAYLYKLQGRYKRAEPLLIESLQIRRVKLGDSHPDTVFSLNDLANLYKSQGRYRKAELLYLETLEIRKAGLGDYHLDTAFSLNSLAVLYDLQRRYGEAEPLLLEALEIRKAELGDQHSDIANSLLNLAALYYNTQRYQQAFSSIQQALEIYSSILGTEHSNTQEAKGWLEIIQQALNGSYNL